ncbi:recombinase family protein [Limnoglobus roseus]|uniref:Recombinase family protein n=1 Tax=Limnoglobus roseus TaxID=2598579 RepID=A0A5C1AV74_9BACT|nr:recombinase family protein [Limnoglobus roseus]QEL20708.1 recombinase family protein [Limnoglobus roseus]
MTKRTKAAADTRPVVRCAIYTRKSSEEGLEQEFNSLDAQREAGEAYVRSQVGEGWTCLADRYDDGGFTGGNTDRPGLRRLLHDIAAGRVDCVVVYKVDRLSRSLLDFAEMMRTFEQHQVGFVSVTQQFNTASSMGRLVLNVLLSFAQFEREIVSERTRDKIAATRRKGKWAGGWPVLGYDVDPQGFKLRVNDAEADRVRAIYALYLDRGSLLPVVEELAARGWANKRWELWKGGWRGGGPFTRTSLYGLLTNPVYVGKVRYKDEVHAGEHAAVVDPAIWQRVQAHLAGNGRGGGYARAGGPGALLRGVLRCTACDAAMSPTSTTKGAKSYRYYTCTAAAKKGWKTCPAKSVPAHAIEQVLLRQVRAIGTDARLRAEVLAQARQQDEARTAELAKEQKALEHDLRGWHGELRHLSGLLRPGDGNEPVIRRLAELQEQIAAVEGRGRAVRDQLAAVGRNLIADDDAATALSVFDPVWEALNPREQSRVVNLLVESVGYDGGRGKVTIRFRPAGVRTLARELADKREGMRA